MKVTSAQIWEFLLQPKAPKHILLFGPQSVLLENLAYDFALTWAQKFALNYKTYATLSEYLQDQNQATQVSLFGAPQDNLKLVIIRSITDRNLAQLKDFWAHAVPPHTLICIGESLTTRAKTVLEAQGHNHVIANGFYEGSVKWRARWINNYLKSHGVSLDTNLCTFLAQNTNDATDLRDLVNKVSLLSPRGPEDLAPLLTDPLKSIDDIVWKFFYKNPICLNDIKVFLAQNTADEMKLLRSLLSTCLKIYYAAVHYEKKADIEEALTMIDTPLNFKNKPHVMKALHTWKPEQLWQCIGLLNQAEFDLKAQTRPLSWALMNPQLKHPA